MTSPGVDQCGAAERLGQGRGTFGDRCQIVGSPAVLMGRAPRRGRRAPHAHAVRQDSPARGPRARHRRIRGYGRAASRSSSRSRNGTCPFTSFARASSTGEPGGPVDLGELLHPARPRRPLELEGVAAAPPASRSPSAAHTVSTLPLVTRHSPSGTRSAAGTGEPSSSSNSRRATASGSSSGPCSPFGQRPGAVVLLRPERAAHVPEQHLGTGRAPSRYSRIPALVSRRHQRWASASAQVDRRRRTSRRGRPGCCRAAPASGRRRPGGPPAGGSRS